MLITTRPMVRISVNCTSLTEARIVVVRSETMESLIARRHRGLELRQFLADQIHGLDHIGIRQALHREDDRMRTVIPGGELIIGRTDRGMADIANADRRAIAIGDDRVVEIGCRGQLVVGLQANRIASGPSRMPFGSSTVVFESAIRTSSSVNPNAESCAGLTSTRIAGCCWPPMLTRPTP